MSEYLTAALVNARSKVRSDVKEVFEKHLAEHQEAITDFEDGLKRKRGYDVEDAMHELIDVVDGFAKKLALLVRDHDQHIDEIARWEMAIRGAERLAEAAKQ